MQNIIVLGMKNAGKSTFVNQLATKLDMNIIKVDDETESLYEQKTGEKLSFREIHKKHGSDFFRDLEAEAVELIAQAQPENCIIDLGGGTAMRESNRNILKKLGRVVWLKLHKEINFERIMANGIPAFFKYQDDPQKSYNELCEERYPIFEEFADYIIEYTNETTEEIVMSFSDSIGESMS
jgi:shikimate dehydrogenase